MKKLPFPECLSLIGIIGLILGGGGYLLDINSMKILITLTASFSFLSLLYFRDVIKNPARLGFWGFLGFLGFLGFIGNISFLKGLFGLFGLFFFFSFLANDQSSKGSVE